MHFRLFIAAFLLILGAAVGTQAPAQLIKPLDVEQDPNGVDLFSGKVQQRLPVLSVPGAPNLRLQQIQDLMPVLSGMLIPNTFGEATYDINHGGVSSEHFDCNEQGDCISKKRNGSGLVPELPSPSVTYYEGGTGKRIHFGVRNGPQGQIISGGFSLYASTIRYPDGEQLSFTYQAFTQSGQTWHRPTSVASSRGYTMTFTYKGSTYGQAGWNEIATATIARTSDLATPLARLTYGSNNEVTDLAGRTWTCVNCRNSLSSASTTTVTSLRLPGESVDTFATQADSRTYGSVTHANWVTRATQDGVAYDYAYVPGHIPQTTISRVTITAPLGFSRTVNIHVANNVRPRITSVVDSLTGTTSYQYDNDVRVTQITYPEGNSVSVIYDQWGNITQRQRTSTSGTVQTVETASFPNGTSCYNPSCFKPIWTRDALGRQTDYTWSTSHGGMLTRLEPKDGAGLRRRTVNEYDSSGRLMRERVCQYNNSGTNATCSTTAERIREFTYWGATPLPQTETVTHWVASGETAPRLTTTYSYDAAGRLLSADGPLAGSDDATYYRYDTAGRRTWEIGPAGTDGLRRASYTIFRSSDDQVSQIQHGVLSSPTDTTLTVLSDDRRRYDSRRRHTRTTTRFNNVERNLTQFSYDARNRLDCTAVRMNPSLWTGTLPGACTLTTQGASGADRITRNHYDAESRVLRIQRAVGTPFEQNYATYTYSPNGNRTSVLDANGNLATMSYDGYGRLKRWTFPSRTAPGQVNAADYEEYGYDANDNRTSLRKRDGSVLTYQYDALGRMVRKIVPERADLAASQTRDVYYGYDISDQLAYARFDSNSGVGVTNSFDVLGRRNRSTISLGGSAHTRVVRYSLDAGGRRTRLTYPDDSAVTFTYDGASRMTGIYEGTDTSYSLWTYAYSDNGRRVRRTASNAQYVEAQADGLMRTTSLTTNMSGSAHDNVTSFGYNPTSQINSRTITSAAWAWTAHVNVDRAYTVNGLNQYATAGSASFTYDANANLTGDGSSTYVYDVENRLVSASGATTAGLIYDPLGRLWQTSGGAAGTIRYVYDGDELIAEYNAASSPVLLRRYVHGSGVDDPILWYEGSGTADRRWLFADHQGSIVGISGASATVGINSYDEYGIPAPANIGRFQYTGQAWIPELRMYHYKARIYSPTLGRFLQTDPVGYDDQVNLYAYVGNDPVNRVDPDGQESFCITSGHNCTDPNLSWRDLGDRVLNAVDVLAVGADLVVGGPTGESAPVLALTAMARNSFRAGAQRLVEKIGARSTVLNRRHYRDAIREARGEVVSRRANGVPHDHINEVSESAGGLARDLAQAEAMLRSGKLTAVDSSRLRESVRRGQRLLNEARSVLRRVDRCHGRAGSCGTGLDVWE